MSSEALRLKELGNKALKKKDYKKALDFYEKAILLDPTETKFFFNSAITHFELKNFKVCIETCRKAVKIGRENSAGSELIAKCFAKEGQAQRELGNLRMAKLAYEKAQEEHKKLDYGKSLSEIEFAMKHLQMIEVVENLYEVVKIDGKGLGCVALKDIKIGTLIVKETPQCVANEELYSKELYAQYLASQLESFFAMSKENQAQFLTLSNSFTNPDSLSDNLKDCHEKINQFAEIYYPRIVKILEINRRIDTKLFNDILCLYKTNAFGVGVALCSRREHFSL